MSSSVSIGLPDVPSVPAPPAIPSIGINTGGGQGSTGRPTADPAVSVCFAVSIDDQSLGTFNSCDGLGCEVVLEQREEGGNNGYVWQLPTRLKFSNVKFTRPLCRDTTRVTAWFASMATGVRRTTATIAAMTGDGQIVAQWGLLDVIPVRWTGPSLSLDSPKVATETVEIAHHGIVANGPGT